MLATNYDSMDQFLNELRSINLLTSDDVASLIVKVKKGCQRSKSKFITSNLRLVVSIAKKYINKGLPIGDLVQEGSIGLYARLKNLTHPWTLNFQLMPLGGSNKK